MLTIDRALIAVHNYEGLVPLARELTAMSIELVALPICAQVLREVGIPCQSIADVTHGDDILEDQVNPLDPHILGGIVAHMDHEADRRALASHSIPVFHLVITNLASPQSKQRHALWTAQESLEHEDIVSPTYIRAAAMHHDHVTILADPEDYATLLAHLKEHQRSVTAEWRRELALKAMQILRRHDLEIMSLFRADSTKPNRSLPDALTLDLEGGAGLKHGQNPHQPARMYQSVREDLLSLSPWRVIRGSELSFGQVLDLDVAAQIAFAQTDAAVVLSHHSDPLAVVIEKQLNLALEKVLLAHVTHRADATLVINRPLDESLAITLKSHGKLETVAAPTVNDAALTILKESLVGQIVEFDPLVSRHTGLEVRSTASGIMVQDSENDDRGAYVVAGRLEPDMAMARDLRLGMDVVRYSRSFAAACVGQLQTHCIMTAMPGVIGAIEVLMWRHGDVMKNSILATDGSLVTAELVRTLAEQGVTGILHLGGGLRSELVVRAADDLGLVIVETGRRFFKY